MHLHARYHGLAVCARGPEAPPFGPGFEDAQIADANTLEVWVTRLEDVADTTVWRLLKSGSIVAIAQVGGF